MVEVIVALALLGIVTMSIGASATFVNRMLHAAEDHEAAFRIAGAIMDSLATVAEPADGAGNVDRFRARWSAGSDGVIAVIITRRVSPDTLAALHAARMSRVPVLP